MLPCPLWPDFHGKEMENKSRKWPVSVVVAIMGQVCRIHSGSALRPHLHSLNDDIIHCLVPFSRTFPFSCVTLKLNFCTASDLKSCNCLLTGVDATHSTQKGCYRLSVAEVKQEKKWSHCTDQNKIDLHAAPCKNHLPLCFTSSTEHWTEALDIWGLLLVHWWLPARYFLVTHASFSSSFK